MSLRSLAWMVSLPGRTCDEWEQVCGAGRRALARKGFCRELEGMTAWKGQWGTVQYWWVFLPLGMSGMGEWVTGAAREVRCVLRGELARGFYQDWGQGRACETLESWGMWCLVLHTMGCMWLCSPAELCLMLSVFEMFCLLSNVSNWNSEPSLNALSSLWCVPVAGGS